MVGGDAAGPLAQFATYVHEGVWHIWLGYDHILFLLSLLLPAVLIRRERAWAAAPSFRGSFLDVAKVVTAFTLAHSITLSLAALGVVSLPSRWVESAIALSVVLAALNNVFPRRRERTLAGRLRLRPAARLRLRRRAAGPRPADGLARAVAGGLQHRRRDRPARDRCGVPAARLPRSAHDRVSPLAPGRRIGRDRRGGGGVAGRARVRRPGVRGAGGARLSMDVRYLCWRVALAGLCALACKGATAETERLDDVIVVGHYDNRVGTTDAASAGYITPQLIDDRPLLRPGEVLEYVPGMIVTQHSGAGKANQYFLRGFNLDHGTDFATSVAGMPVNMRTHAHGQGYTDLNFLIPELISRVDYYKGPYYASRATSPRPARPTSITPTRARRRSPRDLLGAERVRSRADGRRRRPRGGKVRLRRRSVPRQRAVGQPRQHAQVQRRLRATRSRTQDGKWSVTAMGYAARWNSTDQIPQRAVDEGLIGRFGAIDPIRRRSAAPLQPVGRLADGTCGRTAARRPPTASGTTSACSPISPISSTIRRTATSSTSSTIARSSAGTAAGPGSIRWRDCRCATRWAGTCGRIASIRSALYSTVDRDRLSTTREDRVRETSGALYVENNIEWTPGCARWLGCAPIATVSRSTATWTRTRASSTAGHRLAQAFVRARAVEPHRIFRELGRGLPQQRRARDGHHDRPEERRARGPGDRAGAHERRRARIAHRIDSRAAVVARAVVSRLRFRARVQRAMPAAPSPAAHRAATASNGRTATRPRNGCCSTSTWPGRMHASARTIRSATTFRVRSIRRRRWA